MSHKDNGNPAPYKRAGKILLIIGCSVMLLGLILLVFASPTVSIYTLLFSVLVNAASAYLLFFHRND